MVSKLLVIRPEWDKVTYYLSDWSYEIILLAQANSFQVKDLGGEKANRTEFEKFIKKQNPDFIIINGHGSPSKIQGHKNQIILEKDKNDDILKDKVIYALSCHSAKELGPAAVEKGAKAYVGYESPFGFLTNKNKECIPNEDELANIFKIPSNEIPINLIKGKTVGESFEKSQEKFKEMIIKFGSSQSESEAKEIRFWLFWDMEVQVALGDMDATV